jgi:hypothetical protein
MRVRQARQSKLSRRSDHIRVTTPRRFVGYTDGLRWRQVTFPSVNEKPDGRRSDFHCLTGYPRHVAGVRTTEPVRTDAIMKAESVQSKLEGAHVKRSMRTMMILTGGWLSE